MTIPATELPCVVSSGVRPCAVGLAVYPSRSSRRSGRARRNAVRESQQHSLSLREALGGQVVAGQIGVFTWNPAATEFVPCCAVAIDEASMCFTLKESDVLESRIEGEVHVGTSDIQCGRRSDLRETKVAEFLPAEMMLRLPVSVLRTSLMKSWRGRGGVWRCVSKLSVTSSMTS